MSRQPNVLLIWTDEQRFDTMKAYGNSHIKTPNLDRLASQSFVFDRAYCCQPVCTPSRGCILTGRWPHQHGARANNTPLHQDSKTIAELIDPAYRRAYIGKWHLGDEITAQHGFDEWTSIEDGIYRSFYSNPEDLERRSDYHHFLVENGFTPNGQASDGAKVFSRGYTAVMPYKFTKAGFLGKTAGDFIRNHDPSTPFLASVNFLEPHMPFFGPYNDMYDPDELPVGPAFATPPGDDISVRNRAICAMYQQKGFEGKDMHTEQGCRRLRANYYGLVSMVDDAVGEILDALDDSGMADNTIVIFTSDHGEMMGDHGMVTKGVMYEESVHIPLLMRVPWLNKEEKHIEGPISQIDLTPTILDLLDQPLPDNLEGTSRLPVLEGEADLSDNDVFYLWHSNVYNTKGVDVPGVDPDVVAAVGQGEWRCVTTADGWKLHLCATDPVNELFNVKDDPHELKNRFDDPACAEVKRELAGKIKAWMQRVGDETPLPAV